MSYVKEVFERRTYSIPEAAQIIGISRSLAYQMATEGRLPTIRVGKTKCVIPKVALDQWFLDQVKVTNRTKNET